MLHLSADLQANYDRFISRVSESKVVWGLLSKDGWAVSPSNHYEDTTVYPFWSDKAYAQRHCVADWSSYSPSAIDIDTFIDEWLRGMNDHGDLLGPNWNSDLAGLEVEPAEAASKLMQPTKSN
jgi:hypothetical protein